MPGTSSSRGRRSTCRSRSSHHRHGSSGSDESDVYCCMSLLGIMMFMAMITASQFDAWKEKQLENPSGLFKEIKKPCGICHLKYTDKCNSQNLPDNRGKYKCIYEHELNLNKGYSNDADGRFVHVRSKFWQANSDKKVYSIVMKRCHDYKCYAAIHGEVIDNQFKGKYVTYRGGTGTMTGTCS